jgi:hypothetical protein
MAVVQFLNWVSGILRIAGVELGDPRIRIRITMTIESAQDSLSASFERGKHFRCWPKTVA